MIKKILITAALPYANGAIHFGHLAGAYLPGDCYARFERLQGNDILYICGSDEYGIATLLSAEIAKKSPQEHVQRFHEINKNLFEKLSISFDHFSRTTWPGHVAATYQYFQDLATNGYIIKQESEQLYSEADHKFLADRYVVGICPKCGFEAARGDECTKCGACYEATDLKNPRSKLSQAPLVLKKTIHWYLQLDAFKEKLQNWLQGKNWKPNVMHFVKGYIDELRPRAITRDTSWGIPVPLEEGKGKVLYVWFEAPIGYISATKEWAILRGTPDAWKQYWLEPTTKLVQFIGKDNIPFHAAIFPAMTMGQNMPYKLVDELCANEFYNLEGRQFSKSDGWYIDVEDFLTRYTPDQIRYVLAANAPETSDAEFTWKDFQQKCNGDLAGKFGNFIHRTLVFINNNLQGKLPVRGVCDSVDEQFLKDMHALVQEIRGCYQGFRVRRAAQLIMELASIGNVYFDKKKPWQLAKQEAGQEGGQEGGRSELETMLSCCLECCKLLALVSLPIMPTAAETIWSMLGGDKVKPLQAMLWDGVLAFPVENMSLQPPKTLFSKVEDAQIEQEIAKLKSGIKIQEEKMTTQTQTQTQTQAQAQTTPAQVDVGVKSEITIDDVRKLDLRVAKILACERVPKSKKLVRLEVDTGLDKRTVVAGIGSHYEPEALIGKHVIIVANLQPATLMGVQSQGMLLAASAGDSLQVLEMPALPPGSKVS